MWLKIRENKRLFGLGIGLVMSVLMFINIVDNYVDKRGLYLFDQIINSWVVSIRTPMLNQIMLMFTLLGNWQMIGWGLLLGMLLLGVANKWRNAWTLLISVSVGILFTELAKLFFGRMRPPVDSALIMEKSLSFPSGHSYFAIVFYGLITYFWIKYFKSYKVKVIIGILGMGLCLLIGVSRIYLGVHWITDVLAGFSSSLAWLFLTIGYLEYQAKSFHPEINKTNNKLVWRGFWLFTILWISGLGWLILAGI